MPRVMVKGFGEVDLPDGMSQEQMRLALRQMYPTSARQSATDALTPMPSKPMQVEPDMYSRPEVSLRDYLTGVGDTAESFARGAAQGSLGVLGDLQDLGQSAYQEVTSDNPSFGGFVDRLGTNETIFPTASDVGGYIDSVFGENKPEVLSQEGADIASFGGELVGMPLGAAKVPAVAKAVKDAPISLLDAVAQGPSARSPLSQRGAIGVRVQNTPDQEITASKSGNLGPGVYLYEKSTPELADKLINRGMYNKVSKGGDPYSLELEYDDNLNLYETSNKILSDNQVRQLKDAGFDGVRRVVDGVPQEVNIFDPSNVRFPSDESVSEASGLFDQLGDSSADRAASMGFDPDTQYYHGALQDITEFDLEQANPEGYFGSGIYVTTGADDANYNYASVTGADQRNKIEQLAERYADENEIRYGEALEIVKSQFAGNEGVVYPVNIKSSKPFDLTDDTNTLKYEIQEEDWRDYLDDADGDEDYAKDLAFDASLMNEGTGELADFIEAFQRNASEYGYGDDDSVLEFISELRNTGMDYGELSPQEIDEIFRSAELYIDDDAGTIVNNEVFRQSIEDAGFDSVIHDAGIFRNMNNTEGQKHVILFKPNQVRSVNAKFDKEKASSGNILAGAGGLTLGSLLYAQEEDDEYSKVK